jgi:Spy/CpxP family protein refolding chaperone
MKRLVTAVLAMVGVVGSLAPAGAGETAAPGGAFEEAGRLVDQVTGRLRGLGTELAQQWQAGRGPLGRMREETGSPAERPLITIMLHHRADLGLSAEQVSRLEALRGDFAREAIRREADLRIAELDLRTLLDQDPVDLARVEAKIRESAQVRADLRIARLRAIEQGKAVLTPEQRTRLQGLMGSGMPYHRSGAPAPGGPAGPRRSADAGRRI